MEEQLPKFAGPCAKQTVKATLIARNGKRYVSTNYCLTPQTTCPRGSLPSGVGYELCKSVCNQTGHAETNAIKLAGVDAYGSTIYVEGHTFACGNCSKAATDIDAEIRISAPPAE